MSELRNTTPIALHLGESVAGLAPAAISDICMIQCKAMCCRGPLVLTLTKDEVPGFRAHATELGVALRLGENPDGSGWVRFPQHNGSHCPMLDDVTSACRIYEDRPQRCRDFPEKPIPGCAISGWVEAALDGKTNG